MFHVLEVSGVVGNGRFVAMTFDQWAEDERELTLVREGFPTWEAANAFGQDRARRMDQLENRQRERLGSDR